MAEHAGSEAGGSPGIIRLFTNGLSRVTGRKRHSGSTNGKYVSHTKEETAADTHSSLQQQAQLEVDGGGSTPQTTADPESPAAKQTPAVLHVEDLTQQPEEVALSVQEVIPASSHSNELQLQLAQPWNPLSWPSQAMKAAEQRPCPLKRSSDIFDLIDTQLATSKRRRLQPAAPASVSRQLALPSSQPSSQWPAATTAPPPAFPHASQTLTSWQSPTGMSPFRRYIAAPQPSRLSRPASAPFTAGRAPAASPAPASSRATRTKGQNSNMLQRKTASPSPSPVKPFSRPAPSTVQPAFRLGQSGAQLPASHLPALPQGHTSQREAHTDASDAVARMAQPVAAWTPMKSLQPRLAPTLTDRQTDSGKQPAPSSLLSAGLHVRPAVSTPVSARARRFQVRAPSAQKRKAAELETVETEEREEAAEIQRHHKQARRDGEDVTQSGSAHSLGAVPTPTAVLGFLPLPSTSSSQHSAEAPPRSSSTVPFSSQSPEPDEADHLQPSHTREPMAKDYGAPWAAAAAAAADVPKVAALPDAAIQSSSNPVDTPSQPSKAREAPEQPVSVSTSGPSPFHVSAPSPFTAPPKPFGMLQPMSSQPAPFQGFGPSTSAAAPERSTSETQPCPTPASTSGSSAAKPAALPWLPASSAGVAAATPQPVASNLKPPFAFGIQPPNLPSSIPTDAAQHSSAPAHQAAGKSTPHKTDDSEHRSSREASVSSDISGDTAVNEQMYSFSNQRSAQDRLEGLVDMCHQAAEDVEALYTFGRTPRTLADQNQPEVAADEDPPVTPLQNGFPTKLEADKLQALAMAVPLPSPTPSPSPDHPQIDSDSPAANTAILSEAEAVTMDNAHGAEATTISEAEDADGDGTTHVDSEPDDADAATIVLSSSDSQASSSSAKSQGTGGSSSSDASSDDEDVSSVGTTSDEEAAGAATPVLHPYNAEDKGPTRDTSAAAGGWGDAFLKENQSAAKAAADAAAEADRDKAQQEAATITTAPGTQPAPAAGWGAVFLQANQSAAKTAADAAADSDKAEAQHTAAATTEGLLTQAAAATGWGADFLQANQSSAKAAADAAAEVEKAEAQQRTAVTAGTPITQPAAAATWGADFINANQSAAKAAADSAAEEAKPEATHVQPSFMFGLPQAAVGHNMPAFQAALNVPLPSFDSPLPSQPMSTTQAPVSQPSLDRQPIDSGLPAPNSDPEIKVEPVETTNQPGTDAQPVEPLQPTASERIAPAGDSAPPKQRRFLRRKKT